MIQGGLREEFLDPLQNTAVCIPTQITEEKKEEGFRTGEARAGQAGKAKKKITRR
jgi:hypothetical protein